MKEELFRKKSLERISSPERTDEYIKAVNVNLWMVAAACFLVLSGLLLWGIFGKVPLSVKAVTVCRGGEAICYVAENISEDVSGETDFCIDGKTFYREYSSDIPQKAVGAMPDYAAHIAGYNENEWVYAVKLNADTADLADGIYETEVITASVSPLSLLMN